MSAAADLGVGGGFSGLGPGFADPVHDAQAAFRVVLDAMAHPGRIVDLARPLAGPPPHPLGVAATAVALSLCDRDTPVWLDEAARAAAGYIAFHCGSPVVEAPGEASFAFVTAPENLPPLEQFALGTDEYPERSTTLVIEAAGLAAGRGVQLEGPGIRGAARLDTVGLPARFWAERAALAVLFPRGVDVIFVSGAKLAALPRSTRVIL